MNALRRLSELVVRATRKVLTDPRLLFGLMAVALMVELLFAPPGKEK